ncbi:serine racemase [Apiospora rasikravindrae]|uniref:Serine racemase n=1 Tax=Apiospora rasikravindrae TaxID=990691 RepID=A0ABR1SXN0_9PEZI
MNQLTLVNIIQADDRLSGAVKKTPCIHSPELSRLLQNLPATPSSVRVYLKLENLQKAGSFKYRGAMNALSQLNDSELAKGFVTYSSGNHARGLVEVAHGISRDRNVEIPVKVVMPDQAAPEKLRAVRDLGAELFVSPGYDLEPCRRAAEELALRSGARLVGSSEDTAVLEGHGTIGLEFAQQVKEEEGSHGLDVLLVPCGGGGLLAGCLVALRDAGVQVLACEPVVGGGSQLRESLKQGRRVPRDPTVGPSAADGLRAEIGDASWTVISEHLTADDVLQVTEEEIVRALAISRELGMEGSIEPSSAVPLAALLFSEGLHARISRDDKECLNIGIVVTGGTSAKVHTREDHGYRKK